MHTSRLTSTFFCGEPPRPGGQAGRHDRRQQLRGDADRDGEREQHRVDDGAARAATLITKIVTLSTPPTLANSPEKRVRPSWNSVWGWRSPSPTAIRPNWVAAPVATTTASAAPSCTTVPMNRHDDSSASAAPLGHRRG